ncbi:S-adenosyl-L-methionine-dependent methyltransferases superfamily [Chlorella sorokiniana]|uniref:S-adenosyl-L-methionine-dependent methyltransferases superfamily n=1 Tax=Chlorella sorokiniana TaxID=3076 RepID=A0A2P6TX19_CHLSO|nr:S-adenosyl-L-methionine-dependent methyltransferases superfamily [Chlorella sorokiniana]|eukprot:PRW58609.1 S-adenosyl-L-methionine-dependent methyltransferases superfamily [Chlorella sorokiniana]
MAAAAAACMPAGAPTSHRRRCCRRRQVATAAASSGGPLDCSARLAAVRAAEQQQTLPLFADGYAAAAAEAAAAAGGALPEALDAPDLQREALATRFLDEQLLKAATIVNLERDLTQEYNQVVLVGDAFDTRPFRLPWPEGTLLFCVAPTAAHAAADAAFKAAGARVPRGCLLRRVPAELADGASFAGALETAGFRGDRLSVWALQGVACLGLGAPEVSALLVDITNLAAFDSLVAGMLPPMTRRALDNLLASFGLLGAGVDFGQQTDWGRWRGDLALDPQGERPWLFVAQQKRLSNREMGIYEDHVAAAEEVDEDTPLDFS